MSQATEREHAERVRGHLRIALSAAVPLNIEALRQRPPAARTRTRLAWAPEAADIIGSQGDALQFTTKTPGRTANAFNALARGLAALAWQPGGVHVFGLLFCAQHARGGRDVPGSALPCPDCRDDDRWWVTPEHDPDAPPGHAGTPMTTIKPTEVL
jgi:hypothetical protein